MRIFVARISSTAIMKKLLLPCFLFLLAACGQKEEAATAPSAQGYTKEFDYAIDATGMFHPDLTDEDFSDVKALVGQMIADVLNGKLKAYDPMDDSRQMTVDEVRATLVSTDSVYVAGPEGEESVLTLIQIDHTTEFYSVKFREQWRYAPDGAIIDRKVLALAPRGPVFSSDGQVMGYSSLFWIKVN
jgi:hypothetical protein